MVLAPNPSLICPAGEAVLTSGIAPYRIDWLATTPARPARLIPAPIPSAHFCVNF